MGVGFGVGVGWKKKKKELHSVGVFCKFSFCKAMSQDSEEIKTIEHWKWSEMQGVELVVSEDKNSNTPTTTTTTTNSHQFQETRMEVKKEEGGDVEKPTSPPPAVGFGELFRFADGLDYALMIIGSLGAFVHGCSLPLFLRFFADLVNSFGSYANDVDKMTQEVLKVKFLLVESVKL